MTLIIHRAISCIYHAIVLGRRLLPLRESGSLRELEGARISSVVEIPNYKLRYGFLSWKQEEDHLSYLTLTDITMNQDRDF